MVRVEDLGTWNLELVNFGDVFVHPVVSTRKDDFIIIYFSFRRVYNHNIHMRGLRPACKYVMGIVDVTLSVVLDCR